MKLAFKLSIPGVIALTLTAWTPAKADEGDAAAVAGGDRIAAMDEIPARIKATLDRELPGASLSVGTREGAHTGGGYILDVVQMDQPWRVQIDRGGDLIVKRRRG